MEIGEGLLFALIALIFYIPAHILPPVLLTLLYSQEDRKKRKQQVVKTINDCLVTIVLAGAAGFWVWSEMGELLMWPFMVALLPPYYRVWRLKQRVNV